MRAAEKRIQEQPQTNDPKESGDDSQWSRPGFHEIRGLAWSGRGSIRGVEISTDGGTTWQNAQLQEPVVSKAFTRFRLPWNWDGREVVLVSRATDETGYVQPSREQLVAERGTNSQYHCNAVKAWRVGADGSVAHVDA